MAKKLTPWEKFDKTRMKSAFEEIEASPNLRFFVRQIFASAAIDESPFSGNAIETARLCGRQQIGLEIRREMQTHSPTLSHKIELEMLNENLQRNRNETPNVGADDGDGERNSSGDA